MPLSRSSKTDLRENYTESKSDSKSLKLPTILESPNLVDNLSKEEVTKIGLDCVSDFDADDKSREKWKEDNERWMKLATQIVEEKSHPWPNAANVKFPIITTAALQFASRAYPALIGGKEVVKGRVIGKPTLEKEEKAKRVGMYMSYQVHEEMEEWEEDMDKLLMSLPIVGTVFKKTYFSPDLDRNVSELVLAKDLVVNYYAKNLKNASRITHVLYFYPNELEEKFRSGLYSRVDFKAESSIRYEDMHKTSDEAHGLTPPSSYDDDDSPRVILEQHTWLDLDGDGYKEPYIITVDKDSAEVLRIFRNFDYDDILINSKDEVAKIKPTAYFTNFIFIPDPESGIYGFGLGKLLGPINETVNTTINQLLDAGTLSNLQSGFLARGIRMKAGEHPFRPGEWRPVNSTGDDLRKGIFPLPTREPSNVLFQLLGMMAEAGQRVGSVTETMMGENPGQNQPYSTTMRVMEEGLRVFSSIHTRIHRSLKSEYRKLFKLNSKFLDPQKYFTMLDEGTAEQAVVFQQDFDPENIDVRPASDPNIVSEAHKLARAESLLQMAMQGMVNPQEAVRRLLEAQGQPGVEQLMQMPEPQPPQPTIEEQLDIQKFQHQQQLDQVNVQMESAKLEVAVFKDRANAILALAKAESLNDQTILEQVKIQLEAMSKHEETLTKRFDSINNLKITEMQMGQKSKVEAAKLIQKELESERKEKQDAKQKG